MGNRYLNRGAWLLVIILAPLFLALAVSPAFAQVDLADGLVACWNLDELDGTRADYVGSLDLTDVNTVGWNTGQVLAAAAYFQSANSEYLSHFDDPALSFAGDFSIYAWFNPVNTANYRSMVAKDDGAGNAEYNLRVSFNDRIGFYVSNDGTSITSLEPTSNVPPADTWSMVVAWHNNGVGIGLNWITPSANSVQTTTHTTGVYSGTTAFRIGARTHATGHYMDGRIGPVAIWERVLSTDERTALYSGGAGLDCNDIKPAAQELADSEFVLLPSGETGQIEKRITVGDIAIAAVLAAMFGAQVFTIARDTIMIWRARA